MYLTVVISCHLNKSIRFHSFNTAAFVMFLVLVYIVSCLYYIYAKRLCQDDCVCGLCSLYITLSRLFERLGRRDCRSLVMQSDR